MSAGKEFQTDGAATEKARRAMLTSLADTGLRHNVHSLKYNSRSYGTVRFPVPMQTHMRLKLV